MSAIRRAKQRPVPQMLSGQEDGAKAGSVERDPAGDDSLETRAMRLDGCVAIRVPRSGKTPVRRRHARLRRKMRAGGEKRERGNTCVAPCVRAVAAANSGPMKHLSTYFALVALAPAVLAGQGSADLGSPLTERSTRSTTLAAASVPPLRFAAGVSSSSGPTLKPRFWPVRPRWSSTCTARPSFRESWTPTRTCSASATCCSG